MAFALRHPAAGRRAAAAEAAAPEERRRSRPRRGRVAAARGAWAVGSVLMLIARLVRGIVGLIVLLIIAGILLKVLGANSGNTIVRDVHDAARFFVGPFDGMFSIKSANVGLAVNWGIAALVYFLVGGFIARLIARAAPSGVPPTRPVE